MTSNNLRWTNNPRRTGGHCMELLWVLIIRKF